MAKKKPPTKKTLGRPRAPINWEEVDKLLIYGSSGVQVAAFLGIDRVTLYDRCVKDRGVDYTTYSTEKRQKGNSLLLGKQFQAAMGGNTTMLIWLGKQRLDQSEQPQSKQEFNGSLSSLLDVMHLIKSSDDFDALVSLAKNNKKDGKNDQSK